MTALREIGKAEDPEWQLRCDLAAVFRVCSRLGWNEQIGNHHSLMLPGSDNRFLINPRGMLFREVCASNLIACDLDGTVLRGKGELRKVAFHIHARIHLANPAAKCVLHVHPQYLTALSLLEDGRLTLSHHNDLILGDRIAYDDAATGPAASNDEATASPACSATRPFSSWPITASPRSVRPCTRPSTSFTPPSVPACTR